jgi:hypothetical protein
MKIPSTPEQLADAIESLLVRARRFRARAGNHEMGLVINKRPQEMHRAADRSPREPGALHQVRDQGALRFRQLPEHLEGDALRLEIIERQRLHDVVGAFESVLWPEVRLEHAAHALAAAH